MKPPLLLRSTTKGPSPWLGPFFTQRSSCSPFSSGCLLYETDWTCQVPIVSYVRDGAHEQKTDLILTSATGRQLLAGNHHDFVRPPMCQVGHLIDAGNSGRISCPVPPILISLNLHYRHLPLEQRL